jgi:(p)ppGpp synthase/HD superfamily hydrolase
VLRRAVAPVLVTPQRSIPGTSQSFPKTVAALAYATELHAGQRRHADGAPFILHPLEVFSLLYHADAPDHVIAAVFFTTPSKRPTPTLPLVRELRTELEKPPPIASGQPRLRDTERF